MEQVVAGGGRRGARGGTGSRSSQVSGFHKAGLSQLNDSGMTFQVQRRLCNKHSNRGLASGRIIERCSKVTLTRLPQSEVMGAEKLSFHCTTDTMCECSAACLKTLTLDCSSNAKGFSLTLCFLFLDFC